MPRSHKMYGHVVREQRTKKGISRRELALMTQKSPKEIENIEMGNFSGKNPISNEIRNLLAEHLGLAILEEFPPDIDVCFDYLKERFAFEKESIIYFVQNHDQSLVSEIEHVLWLYESAIQRKDQAYRGMMDRLLHTIITRAHPNTEKRIAVDLHQRSYICFYELWLPYLELDLNFEKNRNQNLLIHQKLFSGCLLGDRNQIEDALNDHLQASSQDIQAIINWTDKS